MKLAPKVSLIIFISFCIISSITYVVISKFVLTKFTDIESELIVKDTHQAVEAIKNVNRNLDTKSADWASWDDAYEFITNRNNDFVSSNLEPEALKSLKVDSILLFDINKNLIIHQTLDPTSQSVVATPSSILTYFKLHPSLLEFSNSSEFRSGLISISDGNLFVSIRPISNTVGSKPPIGTIIFAKYLTPEITNEIQSLSGNNLTLHPPSLDQNYLDMSKSRPEIGLTDKLFHLPQNKNVIIGYANIFDLNNTAILTVRVIRNRDIFLQGETGIRFFAVSSSIAAIVITLILSWIINLVATKPISQLSQAIKTIDPNHRLILTGNDEIAELSRSVNQMLTNLQTSEREKVSHTQELESIQQQLKIQVEKTEVQNSSLKSSQKAILNLLEDEKELESQLSQERDRAEAIISSMGEGLLVIDASHNINLINPTAEKLLNVRAEDVVGKPWSEIVIAYDGDTEISIKDRSFAQTIQDIKPIVTDADANHYYQTRSGRKFPVASITTPLLNTKNEVIGAIKVFRDVSAEKQQKSFIEDQVKQRTKELDEKNQALTKAQAEISKNWVHLQEEKARLTTSLNSLPIGYILTNNVENTILVNHSAKSTLELPASVKNLSEISHAFKGVFDLTKACQDCKNERRTLDVPEIQLGKKFLKIFISPIYLLSHHTEEYIGTAILIADITDEKALSRSKDEFFSIASHELRTPLTAIRGNSSLILDYFKDQLKDPTLVEMLNDIHSSSISLINIVNDFLNLSRLEQGRIEFKKTDFDLSELITNTITELSASISEKQLELKIADPLPPSLHINSDKDRIKEVLVNLIGNSIKYTDSGSVTVKLEQINKSANITVTDTGRGIPESQQSLLFRKFQQAGESLYTRDTTKGTGLGLYISKLITEGLGGKIGLSWSKPKEGSCFFINLPFE